MNTSSAPLTLAILLFASALLLTGCDSLGGEKGGGGPGVGPDPAILPAYYGYPAWHPDGEWIAAEHGDSIDTNGDGRKDQPFGGIWLVHAETGRKQPLLQGGGAPAWSADGRRLAVHRGGQIFTVEVPGLDPARIDTATPRQLTTEGNNFFPSWSPDGAWIAYDSNVSGGPYRVWKMRSDGTGKRDISGFSSRIPDWSPDGERIVLQGYVGAGGAELVVIDTTSGSLERLTYNDLGDDHPKFSPDGTRITFQSELPNPETGGTFAVVSILNADGTARRQVSPTYSFQPDWSPDGQRLVFLRWGVIEGNEFPGSGHLWVVNADGTGLRQLTHP